MTRPGSQNVAAEIVARRFLDKGATNLQAKLGAEIASYGNCFLSDSAMRERLLKPNGGGQYHRGSIGRARRLMARAGWIASARVFPTHVPKGAKYTTTYGTTDKHIIWKALELRSPITRGDRRRRMHEQNETLRPPPSAEREVRTRPRVPALPVPPELAALFARVPPGTEPRRNGERPIDRARRADETTETMRAEAHRALERFRKDTERGPPE